MFYKIKYQRSQHSHMINKVCCHIFPNSLVKQCMLPILYSNFEFFLIFCDTKLLDKGPAKDGIFSFSRVSEQFGFRSSEIFWKYPFFLTRKNFKKIVWKQDQTLFLRVLGSKFKKQGQKQGFSNIPNLRKIRNLFYSKLSENYEKMTLKLNFGNREKLVPT